MEDTGLEVCCHLKVETVMSLASERGENQCNREQGWPLADTLGSLWGQHRGSWGCQGMRGLQHSDHAQCPSAFLQGFVPFLVSATAGTTVYGAFDPLIAIADICKKYKIWMHVDVSTIIRGGLDYKVY